MKYRKKTDVIEAFRWTADRHQTEDPVWAVDATKKGVISFIDSGTPNVKLLIATINGIMIAARGDYVLRGINGEIHPLKPNIFDATYEAA